MATDQKPPKLCEECGEELTGWGGDHAPDCDNYDPTPWCTYGHLTKESCDCSPIADND